MISRKPDRVAIIGAGVTGIAAARQALDYGFDPIIFEKSPDIGGIWNYSDDPEVRSVPFSTTSLSSKELEAFSDFPPPEKFSIFMHHSEMLEYLNLYVDHFKLRPQIKLSMEVVAVKRAEDWKDTGLWLVTTRDVHNQEHIETFGAVLMCTGMHSKPSRPFEYRLETAFQGNIIHSASYKSASGYKDKTVVIVGFGNSAIQCACDLAPIAQKVYLSTRRGSWLFPLTSTANEPWDLSFNSRAHYLGRKFVPKYLRNWLWEICINERFDHVQAGVLPDHRFLAANFTFAKNGFFDFLNSRRIEIVQNLLSFTETGVELVDKSVIDHVDEVIFCTGYAFDFSIVEDGKLIFVRENDFHLYKHMYLPELNEIATHNNFAVLGHIQPKGSFIPIVEMQARYFFDVLSEKAELKSTFLMKSSLEKKRCQMSLEYVKTRRHTQIEDYVEYMDDLAIKIGVMPSFFWMLRLHPKLAYKWLFGPSLPYQYRLKGEHSWPDAKDALLTAETRMKPLGRSRYIKSWQLIVIILLVLYLWFRFW